MRDPKKQDLNYCRKTKLQIKHKTIKNVPNMFRCLLFTVNLQRGVNKGLVSALRNTAYI